MAVIIDHPKASETGALRGLWTEAFGDTGAFLDTFFSTAYSPARCRRLILDGAPAAALYWFDCAWAGEKLAYLYAVATKAAYRGQGLCRALMEDTHALLTRQGYSGTLLVPGTPDLFRFYEKLGYATCTQVREFSQTAGAIPVPLRAVGPEEYGALRRRLLPPKAVIQEGENLTFLASQASFYAGEDLLLAAFIEDGVLHCPELLGNSHAAPGILAALGCAAGHFRAPGPGKPFAMYHPLCVSQAPAYFGLAFD